MYGSEHCQDGTNGLLQRYSVRTSRYPRKHQSALNEVNNAGTIQQTLRLLRERDYFAIFSLFQPQQNAWASYLQCHEECSLHVGSGKPWWLVRTTTPTSRNFHAQHCWYQQFHPSRLLWFGWRMKFMTPTAGFFYPPKQNIWTQWHHSRRFHVDRCVALMKASENVSICQEMHCNWRIRE